MIHPKFREVEIDDEYNDDEYEGTCNSDPLTRYADMFDYLSEQDRGQDRGRDREKGYVF